MPEKQRTIRKLRAILSADVEHTQRRQEKDAEIPKESVGN